MVRVQHLENAFSCSIRATCAPRSSILYLLHDHFPLASTPLLSPDRPVVNLNTLTVLYSLHIQIQMQAANLSPAAKFTTASYCSLMHSCPVKAFHEPPQVTSGRSMPSMPAVSAEPRSEQPSNFRSMPPLGQQSAMPARNHDTVSGQRALQNAAGRGPVLLSQPSTAYTYPTDCSTWVRLDDDMPSCTAPCAPARLRAIRQRGQWASRRGLSRGLRAQARGQVSLNPSPRTLHKAQHSIRMVEHYIIGDTWKTLILDRRQKLIQHRLQSSRSPPSHARPSTLNIRSTRPAFAHLAIARLAPLA